MKLCIDAGHGQDNRKPGLYDTGAVCGELQEATVVLRWALALREACEERGIPVFMTRTAASDITPLRLRATRAVKAGCTHLISLHVNDAEGNPQGYETLYRTTRSRQFATMVHHTVQSLLGLKDRGIKPRPDLGVIGNCGLDSCLLELGFITNASDMKVVTSGLVISSTCNFLAAQLAAWRDAHR